VCGPTLESGSSRRWKGPARVPAGSDRVRRCLQLLSKVRIVADLEAFDAIAASVHARARCGLRWSRRYPWRGPLCCATNAWLRQLRLRRLSDHSAAMSSRYEVVRPGLGASSSTPSTAPFAKPVSPTRCHAWRNLQPPPQSPCFASLRLPAELCGSRCTTRIGVVRRRDSFFQRKLRFGTQFNRLLLQHAYSGHLHGMR